MSLSTKGTTMTISTPDSRPRSADRLGPKEGRRKLLRTVFTVDRALSAASALASLAAAAPIADWLGWPTWTMVAVGVALAGNTLLLHRVCVLLGRSPDVVPNGLVTASIAVDLGSAAAIVGLLLVAPGATSRPGSWLLGAAAVGIADIGVAKAFGRSRTSR